MLDDKQYGMFVVKPLLTSEGEVVNLSVFAREKKNDIDLGELRLVYSYSGQEAVTLYNILLGRTKRALLFNPRENSLL